MELLSWDRFPFSSISSRPRTKEKVNNELVFLLIPHIVRAQELNDLTAARLTLVPAAVLIFTLLQGPR